MKGRISRVLEAINNDNLNSFTNYVNSEPWLLFSDDPEKELNPFQYACLTGKKVFVDAILEYTDAYLDSLDNNGETPFMLSTHSKENIKLSKYLAEKSKTSVIEARTFDELTALHIAALYNNDEAVKYLLSLDNCSSFINDHENEMSITALHIAASKGFTKIVELLLKNQANIKIKDGYGNTALSIALKKKMQQAAICFFLGFK